MAKILKNAVISSEVIHITNTTPTPHVISEIEPELINESALHLKEVEILKNEAYQEGYKLGKEEGKAIAEQQMLQIKQQLETTLLAIPQAIEQNRLALNKEIADIVLHVVQQFFAEKEANPQILAQQINQLLKQLNSQQSIELYLHPKEIELLQNGLIQLHTHHLNGLKIKANDNLALGGYVIKTEHGMFDASIEKQIERLKELLIQLRQRGQHAPLD